MEKPLGSACRIIPGLNVRDIAESGAELLDLHARDRVKALDMTDGMLLMAFCT